MIGVLKRYKNLKLPTGHLALSIMPAPIAPRASTIPAGEARPYELLGRRVSAKTGGGKGSHCVFLYAIKSRFTPIRRPEGEWRTFLAFCVGAYANGRFSE